MSYYEFLGMRFMYEVHQVGVLEMGFKYGFFVRILGMSFRHAFIAIGIGIGFRNEFYIHFFFIRTSKNGLRLSCS